MPERVEQVQLPVGGDQLPGPVVGHRGVVHPAVRRGLEHPGHQRHPGVLGRRREPRAERPVQRLGRGPQVRAEPDLRRLGEHGQVRALIRGRGQRPPDPPQVHRGIRADRDLAQRDSHTPHPSQRGIMGRVSQESKRVNRPLLNRRLEGLGHHDLRRDVRARGRDRVDQPGPGLPRPGRPAPDRPGRGRRHPGRPRQPVPARPRRPRTQARHHRTPAALLRPGLRPGHRGPGHRRGHRGGGSRPARPGRAGRRGDRVRALLRLLRREHRHGRRNQGPGHAAPARLPPRPGRTRQCHHLPHPAHPAQQPAQPHRLGVHPRRTGRHRRPGRRARPARGHRRGLRAPGLPRRARPDRPVPGHARADRHDQLGRQDVLVHWLEDRLGRRPLPSWSPRSRRPSSSSPTSAAARSSTR